MGRINSSGEHNLYRVRNFFGECHEEIKRDGIHQKSRKLQSLVAVHQISAKTLMLLNYLL